jgi:hypothetical protein
MAFYFSFCSCACGCSVHLFFSFSCAHNRAPEHEWHHGGCGAVPRRSVSSVANPLWRSTSGSTTSQPTQLSTRLQPLVVIHAAPSPTSVGRRNSSTCAACCPSDPSLPKKPPPRVTARREPELSSLRGMLLRGELSTLRGILLCGNEEDNVREEANGERGRWVKMLSKKIKIASNLF